MRWLALLVLLPSCAQALTDDAVFLVRSKDVESLERAAAQYRPHLSVSVVVTKDAEIFDSWATDERWRIRSVGIGSVISGDAGERVEICVPRKDGAFTYAVTRYMSREIFVGDCAGPDRPFVLAHELGHAVGASDCDSGVMHDTLERTIQPSSFTVEELRALYGK